jgi:superfamily I DNA/RNA helicase
MEHLMQFEKEFPGTRVVLLEENYRSTQTILAAANAVIDKNTKRKKKNLYTKGEEGEQITLQIYLSGEYEARGIAEKNNRSHTQQTCAASENSRVVSGKFPFARARRGVLATWGPSPSAWDTLLRPCRS